MEMEQDNATKMEKEQESLKAREKLPEDAADAPKPVVSKIPKHQKQMTINETKTVMQVTQQVQNENALVATEATKEATNATMTEHISATAAQDTRIKTNDNNRKGDAVDNSTKLTRALTKVSPKEWQKHHDTWLNAVM